MRAMIKEMTILINLERYNEEAYECGEEVEDEEDDEDGDDDRIDEDKDEDNNKDMMVGTNTTIQGKRTRMSKCIRRIPYILAWSFELLSGIAYGIQVR